MFLVEDASEELTQQRSGGAEESLFALMTTTMDPSRAGDPDGTHQALPVT